MLGFLTTILGAVWSVLWWTWSNLLLVPFAYLALFSALSYFVPWLYVFLRGSQNLRTKYGARWALVTGGSSGIGRAIVESLAEQGLNVVIVGQEDSLLHDTKKDMTSQYPDLEFRAIGVDLSDHTGAYVKKIAGATDDIIVQAVFLNAGYIVTGCFRKLKEEVHVKNLECNAVHAMRLSHHFLNHMAGHDVKGCIVLTSSPAGFIPNALAVMYGSTKAFVSAFGASLAIEAAANGVDVTVFHPSPVNSRFLDGKVKLSAFDMAYRFAFTPKDLAQRVFASVGRPCVLYDVGGFAMVTRWICKVIDYSAFAWIMMKAGPYMGDYRKLVMGKTE